MAADPALAGWVSPEAHSEAVSGRERTCLSRQTHALHACFAQLKRLEATLRTQLAPGKGAMEAVVFDGDE